MNIEHLRYVIEVDRAGSISRAADNLYMGQPNLSKAVKELELALNISIFKRTSKGVQITDQGREFLGYAKGILKQYEEMEALGQQTAHGNQNLSIAIPRASYIVEAFTTFLTGLNSQEGLQIDFQETNALHTIDLVSEGHCNLGVIRCRQEYQNYFTSLLDDRSLTWRPLLSAQYYLLLARHHPLAESTLIEADELDPYIELIYGDTSLPNMPAKVTETERGPSPGNKKIRVYGRGSQFDILTRVPRTYMWVSPMPRDLLSRNQLVQRPCRQSPKFCDLLILCANFHEDPLTRAFIEVLEDVAQDISATMSAI